MPEAVPGYLRIRVINRITGAEITNDLPHLHQTSIQVNAFQPGNPGSSAVGSFTVHLHPPGSEGYAAAKAVYDQLDYCQRVEMYLGYSATDIGLGRLYFAGMIMGIDRQWGENSSFSLTGTSDLGWANLSRPFPGEVLANDVTSKIIQSYMGMNETGWMDNMTPYTAGNYTSTSLPALTAGTWTGTTDDGFNVVSCATGTGAALLASTGASANDRWHSHYVEVTGRIKPSASLTSAGSCGIGISTSSANTNNCVVGAVTVVKLDTRYIVNAIVLFYVAGVLTSSFSVPTALWNADDPGGYVPLTIGLLQSNLFVALTINGKVVQTVVTNIDPSTTAHYPFLLYEVPASGTATVYFTNLVHMTRFSADGPSTAAVFAPGTISAATNSLGVGVDPGPTFLEAWAQCATRENRYFRYTPQAFVSGSRTLGTVDFAADPGTDRTASVTFGDRAGNLVSLQLSANADSVAASTIATAGSSPDGGGTGYWRDVGSLTKYGVIEDQSLMFTASDFNRLRRAAFHIVSNKIATSSLGAKTAIVLRDLDTADKFRELDRIRIDCPELGINNLSARVIAYTFEEGSPTQTLMLDQYSQEFSG